MIWAAVGVVWLRLLLGHGWWILLAFATLPVAYAAYVGAVDSVVEFNYLVERLYKRQKDRGEDASRA